MEGMEIVRCQCWRETPNRKWIDAVCIGTREQDACSCGGDQMKCDFYPEIREKAKTQSEPDIQAAIAYYNKGIKEDIFSPEVAAYARLAVEALKKMEEHWSLDPVHDNGGCYCQECELWSPRTPTSDFKRWFGPCRMSGKTMYGDDFCINGRMKTR